MFSLKKIKILDGNSSSVYEGQGARGKLLARNINGEDIREISNFDEINEGDMLLIPGYNFIKTSPIVEFIDRTDDSLQFKTETSIYSLVKLGE